MKRTAEVDAVLADLGYWMQRGVQIVQVTPAGAAGVRVAVMMQYGEQTQGVLQDRYPFRVVCWTWQ